MAPEGAQAPAAGGDFESAVTSADRLELRVWLRLLTCANLIERRVRRNLRDRFAVTLPRFDVLAQLERAPEGLTMGALSRRMMVSNGNVTGLVEHLVNEGLVERRANSGDRRTLVVRLTKKGADHLAAILPDHHAWIGELFAGLDDKDKQALYAGLGRLKESLEAAGANGKE